MYRYKPGERGGSDGLLHIGCRPMLQVQARRERVQMVYCMLAIDLCTGTSQEREGSDGLLHVGYRPISIYIHVQARERRFRRFVACWP